MLASLIVLVLAVTAAVFGTGKAGVLLLVLGALIAIAVLPARYRAVLAERDTWVVMLIATASPSAASAACPRM